jgi:hypothetical protein
MSIESIEQAKSRLRDLSDADWQALNNKLVKNPEYKSSQAEKNLHLLLKEMGVELPDTTEIAEDFLAKDQFQGATADKVFNAATKLIGLD